MARILVIDDDALLRGAIRVVLESAGYEVIEAADGDAGLRLHREQGADLVLVDLFMPERDGLEVIQAVRAEVPDAKIIAMSGGSNLKLDLLDAAAASGATWSITLVSSSPAWSPRSEKYAVGSTTRYQFTVQRNSDTAGCSSRIIWRKSFPPCPFRTTSLGTP